MLEGIKCWSIGSVIEIDVEDKPCDSIVTYDIILIGDKLIEQIDERRVNAPIKDEYLNIPTLILLKELLESPMN
jgi:hypothetical protein